MKSAFLLAKVVSAPRGVAPNTGPRTCTRSDPHHTAGCGPIDTTSEYLFSHQIHAILHIHIAVSAFPSLNLNRVGYTHTLGGLPPRIGRSAVVFGTEKPVGIFSKMGPCRLLKYRRTLVETIKRCCNYDLTACPTNAPDNTLSEAASATRCSASRIG